MKNKKGFTIVELVCMIGILIIIIGIFSLNAIYSQKKYKDEEKENVIAQIMSAADAYVSENKESIKELYEGYGYVDIPVGDLREAGLLTEKIIDPETGEEVRDDEIVRVTLNSGDDLDFKYPVDDDQNAWVLIAEPLTINYNPSASNWCSTDALKGLIENPDDSKYADYPSKLYLMNNKIDASDKARMYRGDYGSSGVNLRVEDCNVNPGKEGTYNITYKYKDPDPDLGTEKTQNRTVYVTANADDIISFEVNWINKDQSIMQLTPENNIEIKITEHLRGNAKRSFATTIGSLSGRGYEISNFSTQTLALSGRKAVITSKRVNSDGSTPTAQEKVYVVVPAEFDIYFNGNGGSVTKPSLKVEYLKAYNHYGSFANASRTGYSFTGWYSSSYGGIKIEEGATVTDPNIRNLYAHWTGNPYTVNFNANGGSTPSPTSKTVIFGSPYGPLPSGLTRTGYECMGWGFNTTYTGSNMVTSSTTVNRDYNHTLYAQWRGKPYTVSFDSNGGKPTSIRTITEYYDSPYTFPSDPTREGFTFEGWYTERTGGKEVTTSTIMKETANITLYAHWKEKTFRVTFDCKGGSPCPSTKIIYYSKDRYIRDISDPKRTGYEFLGWSNGFSSSTYIDKNMDVTALWKAQTYTVTFDSNGGSNPNPKTKEVDYDSAYGPLPTVKRNGYDFDGWYTARTGGKKVTTSTIMKETANITLYAHWKEKTFTITYDCSDGELSRTSETVSQAVGKMGPLITPTRTGYDFVGWYTARNGGAKVDENTSVTRDQTISCHWKAKSYTVTFDVNGGSSVLPTSKPVVYNTPYGTLPTPKHSNPYAIFQGWVPKPTANNSYTKDTIMSFAYNHRLYAKWKIPTVKITFNANGGTVSPSSKVYNKGSTYGSFPTARKCNMQFDGWYNRTSGGLKYFTSGTANSDLTMYAQYSYNKNNCSNVSGCSNFIEAMKVNGANYHIAGTAATNCNVTIISNSCGGFTKQTKWGIGNFSGYSRGTCPYPYSGKYACFDDQKGLWHFGSSKLDTYAKCKAAPVWTG